MCLTFTTLGYYNCHQGVALGNCVAEKLEPKTDHYIQTEGKKEGRKEGGQKGGRTVQHQVLQLIKMHQTVFQVAVSGLGC